MITERINCAERNFSTLLKDFTAYNTGLASLQEKGMKISKSVDIYSDEEYPSMKAGLAGVSESVAAIQDFLGAQVKGISLFLCTGWWWPSINFFGAQEMFQTPSFNSHYFIKKEIQL